MFDSIVNVNDFLSDHWLAEGFPTRLRTLTTAWKQRAELGKTSPLKALAAASADYLRARAELPKPGADGYHDAVTALHSQVLTAAGFTIDPAILQTATSDTPTEFPLLVRTQSPSGEALHVLQAAPVQAIDDLFSDDARLLDPVTRHDTATRPTTVDDPADGLQMLFLSTHAPRYAMLIAGSWLVLTDRERWAEGRYLAFDVDTAMSRRDEKATGELAWHAGLWSADVVLPDDDGQDGLDEYSQESVKHAVGVSADLREGLRICVELIANEVIAARRAAGEPVETVDGLPRELTAQSLRFLYRILFLLFAEARPELGILPTGAPEYESGYGLDRMRELIQVQLTGPSRDGRHLHDSLRLLFRLVSQGHGHTGGHGDGLTFEALRADLFEPRSAELIDSIDLPNTALQQVLALLLLSKPSKGRKGQRGYVSYAQLGINQLGAVYEGLMAYSGFIAAEDLVELAKDGDPDKGSWMVPADRAGDYAEKHVVFREDRVTGQRRKVVHKQGTFVFRLSGRDRQRSASFYTPEVLTRTVVAHALDELLTDDTQAIDLLQLRVCEPALGSGAFLNEAINQLAAEYLRRRQAERGQLIEPADYQGELQRVKAFLALHRVYGVDLNATAVELAEVSLWLNVMHPALRAPWFGLHLRRGNSLIGARRATYDFTSLGKARKNWWDTPPTDRPLTGEIGDGQVHHFLLPAQGWAAVADAKPAKELAPDETAALRAWRKSLLKKPTKDHLEALRGLALRVERLWELATRRLQISEQEVSRSIDVWGAENLTQPGAVPREAVEAGLSEPDGPYQRLRLAMDAWCAMFYWPTDAADPPSMEEWLTTLEELLGIHGTRVGGGQAGIADDYADFEELGRLDEVETQIYAMRPVSEVMVNHPWLGLCRHIAQREGFFHWELDFAPVFKAGGFDLVIGNPPWVRPVWDETAVLAEFDAQFGVADIKTMPKAEYRTRREEVLNAPSARDSFLSNVTEAAGVVAGVTDALTYPQLAGIAPNLYRNFILLGGRLMNSSGVVGFLHPDDHLVHDKAGAMREWAYPRLRKRWAFINELELFEDPSHTEEYSISIYAAPHEVAFLQACGLYHPDTIDQSLQHDGNGPLPGLQFPQGGFDTRPHASRIVHVTPRTLEQWAAILEDPSKPVLQTRAMNPVLREVDEVLRALSEQALRMAGRYQWTDCWHEAKFKNEGYAAWRTSQPANLAGLILQPSHFSILNGYAKQPKLDATGSDAFEAIDLGTLAADAISRTNYTIEPSALEGGLTGRYYANMRQWDGVPVSEFWRLAWRRRLGQNMARTLQAAVIPPGPAHVNTVQTLRMKASLRDTVLVAGLWATLPYDFVIKTLNASDLWAGLVDRLPFPHLTDATSSAIVLRALRLNAQSRLYASLLHDLWVNEFARETWSTCFAHLPALAAGNGNWDERFPLRSDEERRAALVELDALAALALGLSSDHLISMYTVQFSVLRKYESGTWFDAQGHLIGAYPHHKGLHQQKDDYRKLQAYLNGDDCGDLLDRYTPPFTRPDREAEMRAAYEEFATRLGGS